MINAIVTINNKKEHTKKIEKEIKSNVLQTDHLKLQMRYSSVMIMQGIFVYYHLVLLPVAIKTEYLITNNWETWLCE